jgi:hypothetical protein
MCERLGDVIFGFEFQLFLSILFTKKFKPSTTVYLLFHTLTPSFLPPSLRTPTPIRLKRKKHRHTRHNNIQRRTYINRRRAARLFILSVTFFQFA